MANTRVPYSEVDHKITEIIKGNTPADALTDRELRRWIKAKRTKRANYVKENYTPLLAGETLFLDFQSVARFEARVGKLQLKTYGRQKATSTYFLRWYFALRSKAQIDRLIEFLRQNRAHYPDTVATDPLTPTGTLLPLQSETPQSASDPIDSEARDPLIRAGATPRPTPQTPRQSRPVDIPRPPPTTQSE